MTEIIVELDEDVSLPPAQYRNVVRAIARLRFLVGAVEGPALVCRCLHGDRDHARGTGPCQAPDVLVDLIARTLPERFRPYGRVGVCPCRRLWPVPESYPL